MRSIDDDCPACAGTLYQSYDGDTVCGTCSYRVRDPTYLHPRPRAPA